MVLSINQSILIDNCFTNAAKQIWDAYTAQYKEKGYILHFTLFIYLIKTKVSLFKLIIAYNAKFQITINKLFSSSENLFNNLQLALNLHGIEIIYPNFYDCLKVFSLNENSYAVNGNCKTRE